MASAKRCHYEVLGLSRDCSPDEIRTAYRKLALQRHPDKLVKSGVSEAEATAQFQELVHAYEVLADPKERAWYDSHRSQILFSDVGTSVSNSSIPNLFSFFSNTVFNGYSDSGKGFYKVYSDVFDNVYGNEISYARKLGLSLDLIREAPLIGNLESPYAQVTAFYNYWLGFCTVMDFGWVDMYDAAAGVNRKSRRVMEEDNKKLRKKAKREYNDTVRGLAEFVKKRDKRVIDMLMKKNLENEKRREEEKERKKKLEKERLERAKAYEEPEWAKINEEIVLEEISPDEDGEVKEDKELYCVVCSKKFKSEKQWQNHEKSKKHKEKVAALKDSFLEEDELINGGESDGVEEKINEDPGIEEEDELINADESYGVEEIEERIKEDLGIKEEEVVSEDDDYKEPVSERNSGDGNGSSEEDKFFDVDETKSNGEYAVKGDVGSSGADGRDGDDVHVDDISVLEAMLSGRKNRKKAAVEEKSEFMEYDNRKVTRKNRRKDKSKKNKAESVDADEENSVNRSDEANGFAKSSNEASGSNSLSMNEHKSMEDNDVVVNHRKEKGMGKKEANAKLKNMPKGKKGKTSSKNMDDYSCETCGEEFESRNKLHKHLGETGHAATKLRR